jgi:hypothetical protein
MGVIMGRGLVLFLVELMGGKGWGRKGEGDCLAEKEILLGE